VFQQVVDPFAYTLILHVQVARHEAHMTPYEYISKRKI